MLSYGLPNYEQRLLSKCANLGTAALVSLRFFVHPHHDWF